MEEPVKQNIYQSFETEGFMFNIPQEAVTIISTLEAHGHEAYLVGGCVRDFLMGVQPKDYDICTSALPEDVLVLFDRTIPTGIKHGTITVIINRLPFEVTTFRIDSEYTDHRRPDEVQFSRSLEDDLKRRDFTINAIAFHPQHGIIDPFGGLGDIQNKIIRAVGAPIERFQEDALRMLRAVRFKARLGFSVDPATQEAIVALSKTIRYVSRERILAEMNGILLSPFPCEIRFLFQSGLDKYVFPVPVLVVPETHGLRLLPEKLSVRWAALLREAGFCDPCEIRFMCRSFTMSTALTEHIVAISSILQQPLPQNGYALREKLMSFGIEAFSDALAVAEVYFTSKSELPKINALLQKTIDEKHCTRMSDLAVNGTDLIDAGFSPGKHLGNILEGLLHCVLQKPEINRKDILLAIAQQMREQ